MADEKNSKSNPVNNSDVIFSQAEQQSESAANQRLLHGIIGALITENPTPWFSAIQQNTQLRNNRQTSRQFLGTPEFQNIDKEYQDIVSNFAGKGDVENAYQFINAGRLAKQRKTELAEKAELEGAAKRFAATGNPKEYEHVLLKQNPQAWATLQGKSRSERRQNLQDVSQFAANQLKELEGTENKAIKKTQEVIQKVLAQKPTAEDLKLSVEELAARFGLTKAESMQFKSGVNKAGKNLKVRADDPGAIAKFFQDRGWYDPGVNIGPEGVIQVAEGQLISPEQAKQQKEVEEKKAKLKNLKTQSEAAQAQEAFFTAGMTTPPAAQPERVQAPHTMVQVLGADGQTYSIPASDIENVLKNNPGSKIVGRAK